MKIITILFGLCLIISLLNGFANEPKNVVKDEAINEIVNEKIDDVNNNVNVDETEQQPIKVNEESIIKEEIHKEKKLVEISTQNKSNTTNTTSNTNTESPKSIEKQYQSYKMYVIGKCLTYENGGTQNGQSIINNNPSVISTWGGVTPWSGSDNKNTHFIGHNYSAFSGMGNMTIGSEIIVTNENGNPTFYQVTNKYVIDKNATGTDGKDYWNDITGIGSEEIITLQTCKDNSYNWIVVAKKYK